MSTFLHNNLSEALIDNMGKHVEIVCSCGTAYGTLRSQSSLPSYKPHFLYLENAAGDPAVKDKTFKRTSVYAFEKHVKINSNGATITYIKFHVSVL